VWVGRKEADGSVSHSAQAGVQTIEFLNIRWDGSEFGQGAIGRSIRFGVPQTFAVEPNSIYAPWFDFLSQIGIHSVASFPLLHEGEVFGCFALYSYSSDFFNSKVMAFFEHFSTQLALLFSQAKNREELKQKEARYREILEHMSNGVAVYDVIDEGEDFIIKEFNTAAERTEQRPREEILGRPLCTAFPYAEALGLPKAFKVVWQTGNSEHISSYYEEDGKKIWRENFIYKLPTGEIVSIYNDITHRKHAEEKIWYQAHHDALTALPNRLLFNDHLNLALAQARRRKGKCAVIFLDLDRFKLINDTLGHSNGDLLLQSVAQRLRKGLYEGDTIARQGGDEFLILLPELNQEEAAATVAEKILRLLAEPFYLDNHEVFVSSSLGISLYPTDGENIETLLKHADTAFTLIDFLQNFL
jgi:diguanylate cyclase (GGDEF)-like protein/PAS domain S-box-containing protein